jgi:TDG/mug DNA glycosylase family protein
MSRRSLEFELARGFPPVIGREPTVLVLGSLPGVASLEAREYYAKPQNAFWSIMGSVCGAEPRLAYSARLNALRRAGIAVWDVLHAAERPGSLDADIVAASQQVNDIAGLLGRNPSIGLVAFNGQKAAAIFRRRVEPDLSRSDVSFVTLPSTSPAYASLRPEAKLSRWRAVLVPHLRAD